MLVWDLNFTTQMGLVATPCDQPPLALSSGPHLVYLPEVPPPLHIYDQSHHVALSA